MIKTVRVSSESGFTFACMNGEYVVYLFSGQPSKKAADLRLSLEFGVNLALSTELPEGFFNTLCLRAGISSKPLLSASDVM